MNDGRDGEYSEEGVSRRCRWSVWIELDPGSGPIGAIVVDNIHFESVQRLEELEYSN